MRNPEARFDSNILDMVSYNMGVALVLKMKQLEYYNVAAIPISDRIAPRPICLLWPKHAELSPQVEEVRRRIMEWVNLSEYL